MGVKHLLTPQGHTPPTFMGLLRNCNGPSSRDLSLFSLHYALEISSNRGAPKSVPIPVPLPPNVPDGWNLGQRLMAFSSQAGKSFPGSTVQVSLSHGWSRQWVSMCPVPPLVGKLGHRGTPCPVAVVLLRMARGHGSVPVGGRRTPCGKNSTPRCRTPGTVRCWLLSLWRGAAAGLLLSPSVFSVLLWHRPLHRNVCASSPHAPSHRAHRGAFSNPPGKPS